MKTPMSYAEKLMAHLQGSPEVRVLIEREKRKAAEDEKQARIDCLAHVKSLRLTELEAKQKLDLALSAVEAAEAKVMELKIRVAITSNAHTDAQQKRGRAENDLVQLHGEGVVLKTLHKLDRLILKTENEINILELARNPHLMVDGQFTFRPVDPNVLANQTVLKQRLAAMKLLQAKAKEFVEAELAPNEIKELCESICRAVGQPLQPAQVAE